MNGTLEEKQIFSGSRKADILEIMWLLLWSGQVWSERCVFAAAAVVAGHLSSLLLLLHHFLWTASCCASNPPSNSLASALGQLEIQEGAASLEVGWAAF